MSSKKKAGDRHIPPGLPPDLRGRGGGGNPHVPEPGARLSAHSAASNSATQRPHPQSASHPSQIPHTVPRSDAHQSHPPEFESGPDFDATASDVRYRSNFPSNHPEFHGQARGLSPPRSSRRREKSAERTEREIRKEEKKKMERKAVKKAKALRKGLKILKESRKIKRKRKQSSTTDSTSSSSDSDSSSDSSRSKSKSRKKNRKSKSAEEDTLSLANMSLSESTSSHGKSRGHIFLPPPPNPSISASRGGPDPPSEPVHRRTEAVYRIPKQSHIPVSSDTGTALALILLSLLNPNISQSRAALRNLYFVPPRKTLPLTNIDSIPFSIPRRGFSYPGPESRS